MKNKKRKSFYNNKHRNEKWTEEPKGRKIDFADKYAYTDGYSDKYNETTRVAHKTAMRKKEKKNTDLRRFIAFVTALILIGVGYTGMDVHITRYAKPAKALLNSDSDSYGTMSQLDISLNSLAVDSISLDNSVMLDSVIEDVRSVGYNSITFDAKRTDGTIGYRSSLATIDTYAAQSNFATEPKKSIEKLISNDILPVARICCYADNVVANQSLRLALLKDGKPYTDKKGNAYLNPANDSTYAYIKDIVTELYDFGVTVFVLTGCDIPKDAGDVSGDGFDTISKRLSDSLNGEAKFIQEVDVGINGIDAENGKATDKALKSEIKKLGKIKSTQVYYISTKIDDKKMYKFLRENKELSFIIS